jgi:hypothetical protein
MQSGDCTQAQVEGAALVFTSPLPTAGDCLARIVAAGLRDHDFTIGYLQQAVDARVLWLALPAAWRTPDPQCAVRSHRCR